MLLPVVLPCRGAGPDDCMQGSTWLLSEAWVLKSEIFLFIFIYNILFYCSSCFPIKWLITTSYLGLFRSYYELAENFISFLYIAIVLLFVSHRCSCFLHVGHFLALLVSCFRVLFISYCVFRIVYFITRCFLQMILY